MTTSGTYSYNPSVDTVIRRALRQCNALSGGETPTAVDAQNALTALNAMTKAWQASGIHVWSEISGIVFMQPNQNVYQIGLGTPDAVTQNYVATSLTNAASAGATSIVLESVSGLSSGYSIGIQLESGVNFWTTISGAPSGLTVTLATALPSAAAAATLVFGYASSLVRPLRMPAAQRFHLSSEIETSLMVMSRLDYAAMPNKENTGTVTQFFFDPQLTYALLHVWPSPADNTDAVKFTCQRPLQDFNTLANTADFPQEWIAALTWNLAVEIAPEYDVPLERFQMIKGMANEHKMIVSGWDREPESVQFGLAMDGPWRT